MASNSVKQPVTEYLIIMICKGEEGDVGVRLVNTASFDKCKDFLKSVATTGKFKTESDKESVDVVGTLVVEGRILPIKDDFSKILVDGTEVALREDESTYINGFVVLNGVSTVKEDKE